MYQAADALIRDLPSVRERLGHCADKSEPWTAEFSTMPTRTLMRAI
jgi:hypothetical protein